MNNFFAYIQQVELMTFFSGYTLLYALIMAFAGNKESRNNFKSNLIHVLPLSYAVVSSLYFGLLIKNLYYSYSSGNITPAIHHPFLVAWAILALLFWIPLFRKKEVFTLLHNLVFFFILVKDIFVQMGLPADENVLKNDMRIYTVSFLLNVVIFILMAILHHTLTGNKKGFRYR